MQQAARAHEVNVYIGRSCACHAVPARGHHWDSDLRCTNIIRETGKLCRSTWEGHQVSLRHCRGSRGPEPAERAEPREPRPRIRERNHVRLLRGQRGWTQQELADHARVSLRVVQGAELGQVHQLRVETKQALVRALGLDVAELRRVFPG